MKQCYEKFKAIGEETRFRITSVLAKSGLELCAFDLIKSLKKPQYTVSKSVSILVKAGIINERREGKMMLYSVNRKDPQVKALLEAVKVVSESPCGSKDDFTRLEKCISEKQTGVCPKG